MCDPVALAGIVCAALTKLPLLQTPSEYAWGMSLVLCLVVSMYLHEVGHLLAMRLGGMKCTAIVMHGFGGATVPESPALHTEEFGRRKCLALGNFAAGPGANIALAAVFFMARRILKLSGVEEGPILDFWHGNDPALWFMYAAFMNVALAIYNLLPIYPLDVRHGCLRGEKPHATCRLLTCCMAALAGWPHLFLHVQFLLSGAVRSLRDNCRDVYHGRGYGMR